MERRSAGDAPAAGELAERLRAPLLSLRLAFGPAQAELVAAYLSLLLPWNERVNLTGARSAAEVVDRHLADAFAWIAQLPAGPQRVIDVGAGAGFLGVTAAILRPDLHCVLLEPIRKKHTFLRAVARELPLGNLEPLAQRLEAHAARADFLPYDVAISQATWPPAEWFARALPLLRPGGLAFAFEPRDVAAPLPATERIPYRVGSRSGTLLRAQKSA